MASLYTDSQLGMPGHFTSECIKQGVPVAHFTRFLFYLSMFYFHGFSMSQRADNESYKCATKTTRHKTCLFGIEDLKAIAEMPHLTWNKVCQMDFCPLPNFGNHFRCTHHSIGLSLIVLLNYCSIGRF